MRIIVVLSCLVLGGATDASPAYAKGRAAVRKPSHAGQFYPSDPQKLAAAIDGYLEDAVTPFTDRPIAVVCPHAGYIYSAQIAADAYKQASRYDYDLVVILGVNHTTAGFRDVSIYPSGGFETPLGVAAIDEELAERLMAKDGRFRFDPAVHAREHSIEVQVPFVQRLFPKAKILPAVVGAPDPDMCERFGEALAEAVKQRKVLIVASCDLSHFPSYEDARRVDGKTLGAIAALDTKALRSEISSQMGEGVPELGTCACGEASVLVAMVAARRLGATGGQIISYANSGDTALGDRSRVVGYGAIAFVAGQGGNNAAVSPTKKAAEEKGATFDEAQERALLSFARKTIRQYLTTQTAPLARGFDSSLERQSGAFVTLRKNGELRGCIGHMKEDIPLCQVVGYCALQAAFNDRRFPPVEIGELDAVEIEISVLTPYETVRGYDAIRVGTDGVLMKKDGRSAVFLPSVAVEQGWTRDEMLSHLSLKAGLPADAWKKNAEFYTFQAVVFGESETR
jgi:AmmeMemoRadiSam system protein B/AmmeMemoRadiSam system protein A